MGPRRRKRTSKCPERPAPSNARPKAKHESFYERHLSPAAIRETVELLAVALVLTFLVRTFEVEAFVIPTGSMAPTLMGRHKDVACPECGYTYRVGASRELDQQSERTGLRVISGTCPMCRFTMDVSPDNTLGGSYPSFSGDRILAGKTNYQLGNPRRWDVVVFRFPIHAATNFIKRIAGLPNETVRIEHGDVWVRPEGAAEFSVVHKPPEKVLAMMQPVYDDDYVAAELIRRGWPPRWSPIGPADAPGAWKASKDLKTFHTDGTTPQEVWIGYRHVTPSYDDWAYLVGIARVEPRPATPQLIRDFTAYDTAALWYSGKPSDIGPPPAPPQLLPQCLGQPPEPLQLGLNWVGDLIVEFELNVAGQDGSIIVELVKGGHHFRCRLNLADGTARLSISGVEGFHPSSAGIRAPGSHRVRLANVDHRLLLWIDGRLAKADASTSYAAHAVDTSVPNEEDLLPVRIGSDGAAAGVSHLKIYRDIYYVAQRAVRGQPYPSIPTDLDPEDPAWPFDEASPDDVAGFFSDPARWAIFGQRLRVEFKLKSDQYFMLGDNSAQSDDSRLWDEREFFVRRDLLVGEALVVYWPHSWRKIPGTPIPFPFFPNFARMRFIR